MSWNQPRVRQIRDALSRQRLDALVCARPSNVLLLSGYWPIVGTAVAVATAEQTVVLAPKDEKELAQRGFADTVQTFEAGSLEKLLTASAAIEKPVAEALGSCRGRIGIDMGEGSETSPYAAMHLYGQSLPALVECVAPAAQAVDAGPMLAELRALHTPAEIECIRLTCRIAATAFAHGATAMKIGMSEVEAAAHFRHPLYVVPPDIVNTCRADGFAFCMAGPNAATAYGAYARSRGRRLTRGDLVLVHCNSYVDGFWTDITRTFCLGTPTEPQREMYDALLSARRAALSHIRPGVRAADVDRAARDVLTQRRFGEAFKHPTGHGVGFAAIDHNALPRLHPRSPDVLEEGMVFNVEPGIYLDDSGMRHCDMVAVTADGHELLTPFQHELSELSIPC